MKEDNFFLAQIEDKLAQCENKYIVTRTGFWILINNPWPDSTAASIICLLWRQRRRIRLSGLRSDLFFSADTKTPNG